ncbi:hypothetical protein QMM44_01000 [Leptospira santarosai]|nr:hypothetical protein [Leptospira santarosai]MDI7202028.1 hypothetical protein [Leptospira santarosai]
MVSTSLNVDHRQLEISIRWHLNSGYRIERTVEILADRGATRELVNSVWEKMEREREVLRRVGK